MNRFNQGKSSQHLERIHSQVANKLLQATLETSAKLDVIISELELIAPGIGDKIRNKVLRTRSSFNDLKSVEILAKATILLNREFSEAAEKDDESNLKRSRPLEFDENMVNRIAEKVVMLSGKNVTKTSTGAFGIATEVAVAKPSGSGDAPLGNGECIGDNDGDDSGN
jgi:hypothetical protein